MSWFDGFEPICRSDVPLRAHTWYQLGGPARWMLTPRDEGELAAVVDRCRKEGVAWRMLGRGANLLVRDGGFDGAVLRLTGEIFEKIAYDGGSVAVGAGADFPKFVRDAFNHSLVGLEALAGIPGTIGGIVRMNAGGKYGEIRQFVRAVRVLNPKGEILTLPAEQVGFRYRHTDLDGFVVLGAVLELEPGDRDAALRRHREIWNEKYDQQPPVSARSAGCIFKNPPGQSAGRLIDEAGLKGFRMGAAEISRKHANFIVADAGATAQNVLDLIALAKDRVWNRSGVSLELEIEVW
ncbi:MAG: UDP-N-acetylmuramate dehydrogenase [Planctomycetes bacterium]|nr:UDP-N-acetylmuramate dehydrogenase [Planctomycetota bacterium]